MTNEYNFFEEIKEFLSRFTSIPADLTMDQDLFFNGYMPSLAMVSLVLYLESQSNIQLNEKDLSENNFRTIRDIYNLVKAKTGEHEA